VKLEVVEESDLFKVCTLWLGRKRCQKRLDGGGCEGDDFAERGKKTASAAETGRKRERERLLFPPRCRIGRESTNLRETRPFLPACLLLFHGNSPSQKLSPEKRGFVGFT
jgi:hypothetical protein